MSDSVLLAELISNYDNYKGKTFIISDCPYYINNMNVHTYTMTIGNKGGCSLLLDNGATVVIPRRHITGANVSEGIPADTTYYRKVLVLPVQSKISNRIQSVLQAATKSLAEYKHLYESKKKTVNHIQEILKDHPEYLI